MEVQNANFVVSKRVWGLIDMIKMKLEINEVFTIAEYTKKIK